jgi:integrase
VAGVWPRSRRPFDPTGVTARARRAWDEAALDRITLHECRNIEITYGRYGHLMPANEDEAAGLLDSYLARADTEARVAQLDVAPG